MFFIFEKSSSKRKTLFLVHILKLIWPGHLLPLKMTKKTLEFCNWIDSNNCIGWVGGSVRCKLLDKLPVVVYLLLLLSISIFEFWPSFFSLIEQRQLCPIGRDKSWCPPDELVQFSPKLHTLQSRPQKIAHNIFHNQDFMSLYQPIPLWPSACKYLVVSQKSIHSS